MNDDLAQIFILMSIDLEMLESALDSQDVEELST